MITHTDEEMREIIGLLGSLQILIVDSNNYVECRNSIIDRITLKLAQEIGVKDD